MPWAVFTMIKLHLISDHASRDLLKATTSNLEPSTGDIPFGPPSHGWMHLHLLTIVALIFLFFPMRQKEINQRSQHGLDWSKWFRNHMFIHIWFQCNTWPRLSTPWEFPWGQSCVSLRFGAPAARPTGGCTSPSPQKRMSAVSMSAATS